MVGENFFSPLPQCGCVAPALRIIWHTAPRLDFGERTPAGCIDAGHSAGVTSLPLGEAVGLYFYTAASGGGLSYSVTMVDDLSRVRGGILVSSRIPCAPAGQASSGWGWSPSPSVIILYHTLDYLSTGKMHKFGIFIVLFFVAFAN